MKIIIVSSRDGIKALTENEEFVHLTFRPSNTDIFEVVKRCSNLKAIQVPTSYMKTVSKSTRMFLEMQGIELLEGDVWGHRTDINNYSEISQVVYDAIADYRKDGLSDDEIREKLERDTKLNSSVIDFILKK